MMELQNWSLRFPLKGDMEDYHKTIGGLSDFMATSKPGDVFPIKTNCQAVGKIIGHTNPEFEDGSIIETSLVQSILRLESKGAYTIRTENSEYLATNSAINPKFKNEAWVFGQYRS